VSQDSNEHLLMLVCLGIDVSCAVGQWRNAAKNLFRSCRAFTLAPPDTCSNFNVPLNTSVSFHPDIWKRALQIITSFEHTHKRIDYFSSPSVSYFFLHSAFSSLPIATVHLQAEISGAMVCMLQIFLQRNFLLGEADI
jgi:hypothetical protein